MAAGGGYGLQPRCYGAAHLIDLGSCVYVKTWMTGDSCQSWAGPILAGGDFSVIEDYFLSRN